MCYTCIDTNFLLKAKILWHSGYCSQLLAIKSWLHFLAESTFFFSPETTIPFFFLKFEVVGHVWSLIRDKCMPVDAIKCAKIVISMIENLPHLPLKFAVAYWGLAKCDRLHYLKPLHLNPLFIALLFSSQNDWVKTARGCLLEYVRNRRLKGYITHINEVSLWYEVFKSLHLHY